MTPTAPGEMPVIRTVSGLFLPLLDPQPWMVRLQDVAIGLSRCGRWSGQLSMLAGSYTVGEHSLHVVAILKFLGVTDPEVLFEGLMHDAHEGLIGDLARPMKVAMRVLSGEDRSVWDEIEDLHEKAVGGRFGLRAVHDPIVKLADRMAQEIEAYLFYSEPFSDRFDNIEDAPFPKRTSSEETAAAFMTEFHTLNRARMTPALTRDDPRSNTLQASWFPKSELPDAPAASKVTKYSGEFGVTIAVEQFSGDYVAFVRLGNHVVKSMRGAVAEYDDPSQFADQVAEKIATDLGSLLTNV